MTSYEYAEQFPSISEKRAIAIVEQHGLDPEEAKADLGDRFTETEALIAWLGY